MKSSVPPCDYDPSDPLWSESKEAVRTGGWAKLIEIDKLLIAKGNYSICADIGNLYERGVGRSIPRNIQEALAWYQKGVDEINDARCHIGIGRAYYLGKGVEKDYAIARTHFEIAHDIGMVIRAHDETWYKNDLPVAALFLGWMYALGQGVKIDIKRAKEYLEPLLSAGYPGAHRILWIIALSELKFIKAVRLYLTGRSLTEKIYKEYSAHPRLFLAENWTRSLRRKNKTPL